MMDFSLQTPETNVDFNYIVGPGVTAMSENAAYEHRLHDFEQKHSPLSMYEMDTVQNPHNFQRQLMQKMFARPEQPAATSIAGAAPPVTVFRRLTDTFKEMTAYGVEK
ncbi:unnamed protein product [Cylindrotheca closterium]|uniref:Uncharacterized protein n=1 Tax=Cylindrotheca closterium TaxID=2856 RepID=A0AAD2PUY2_9STRA|nr:unnamed protein product [Cylindrotheca closterium]